MSDETMTTAASESVVSTQAPRFPLSRAEMNIMLAAVEFGFLACECGDNLQRALANARDLYCLGDR